MNHAHTSVLNASSSPLDKSVNLVLREPISTDSPVSLAKTTVRHVPMLILAPLVRFLSNSLMANAPHAYIPVRPAELNSQITV